MKPPRHPTPLAVPSPATESESDAPYHATSPSSTAIIAPEKEKFHTPMTSPIPFTPPKAATSAAAAALNHSDPHGYVMNFNRREEGQRPSALVWRGGGESAEAQEIGREIKAVEKAALGFRIGEILVCLIAFAIMASDKTKGWSGDSFDRYREYRFCVAVNVIGFVYAAFQACNLAYNLTTGKHVIRHHLRHLFDFIMDQILAYLLISASSAAATRVDDWQSNWGKDEFTEKASASVSMSFIAFVAFAISSLISGYNLCEREFS